MVKFVSTMIKKCRTIVDANVFVTIVRNDWKDTRYLTIWLAARDKNEGKATEWYKINF